MTYSPRNFAGLLWFVAIAIVLFSHNRVSHAAEVKTLVLSLILTLSNRC